MIRIEADAVIPALPSAVWGALLDYDRWTRWAAPGAAIRLEQIEPLQGEVECVGARRRCAATLTRIPLVGNRGINWLEQVTDLDPGRTIEYEVRSSGFRKLRTRLWLVDQPDGQTRVRCRVSYSPAGVRAWLGDALFLRRHIAATTAAYLGALAASFAAPEAPATGPALEAEHDGRLGEVAEVTERPALDPPRAPVAA